MHGMNLKRKRKRKDVQEFEFNLEDNIFKLHEELISKKYKHGEYKGFLLKIRNLDIFTKQI